jgi:hypothetical protein
MIEGLREAVREAVEKVGCEPFNEEQLVHLLLCRANAHQDGEIVIDWPVSVTEAVRRMEQEPETYGGLFKTRLTPLSECWLSNSRLGALLKRCEFELERKYPFANRTINIEASYLKKLVTELIERRVWDAETN